MYLPTIIVAFLGSLVLVKATDENSCTSTATVSVTTDILPTALPAESTPISVAESTGFVTHTGPIATPISVAESTGFVTHTGPIDTHSFSSIPTTNPLVPLNPSALSSLASAIESSSYPYNLSFGPGGGINPIPTNLTTIQTSTSKTTATSTSSTSETSTSTTTSSAAATTTTAAAASSTATTTQPLSGAAVATAIPAAKGANLALAVVAGGMLLL